MKAGIIMLPIDKITKSVDRPILNFDELEIAELTNAIRECGCLTPLVVSLINDNYELVVGEKRYIAAKRAGLKEVPVVIKFLSMEEIRVIDKEKISIWGGRVMKAGIIMLPTDKITRSVDRPIPAFDELEIAELTNTIRECGCLTPLVVSLINDNYELVVGEKRYIAAKRAGLKEVPVVIKFLSMEEIRAIDKEKIT